MWEGRLVGAGDGDVVEKVGAGVAAEPEDVYEKIAIPDPRDLKLQPGIQQARGNVVVEACLVKGAGASEGAAGGKAGTVSPDDFVDRIERAVNGSPLSRDLHRNHCALAKFVNSAMRTWISIKRVYVRTGKTSCATRRTASDAF
ncbi:MAG: hypothetical protein ACE5JO_13195 [Candidatus Binatia bacterium]